MTPTPPTPPTPPAPPASAPPEPRPYRDISPADAYRARGRARLVDVREAGELALDGYIPGAEHVPLGALLAAAHAWDRAAPLVLVCRSGNRSGRAAGALAAMGFGDVMNLAGGMLAYVAAGLPVTRT